MQSRKRTFTAFTIAVISLMIIIFNNTIDLVDKLFNPEFNLLLFIGFGVLIIPACWYIVYNWN